MHVLDFAPMWSPATHALSVTLPVALDLAEARGLTGREVLTALIKGIEIQGWLREASGQYTPDVLKFHPPGLVGPMGAVAVASHLLRLDPKRMANAFGIAGSRAGSLFSNVGTMTKSTHCGQAAAMGLLGFGHGGGEAMAVELGIPFIGRIPIYQPIREGSDAGVPLMISEPESPAARAFMAAAERTAAQVSIASYNRPTIQLTVVK
jgi:hypothetical protein